MVRLFIPIVLSTIILDQISKYIIQKIQPQIDLWLIKINYVINTGAGFGILQDKTTFLALVSLIVAILLIVNYKEIPTTKFPQIMYAILLGGVIGNFIDRVARKFVIDFISIPYWPSFNIADAGITIGIIGLIWYYWKNN